MSRFYVLGVDVGFASVGVALLGYGEDRWCVESLSVIETKKSEAKRKVLSVEDNVRRAQEIGKCLARRFDEVRVIAVAAEAFSPPRNSATASKIGMMVGVLAELARARKVPLLQASPQAVKLAATGSRSASKDDVERAMRTAYPESAVMFDLIPRSKREHAADACAAALACLNAPEIQMVLRSIEADTASGWTL